VTLIIAVPRDDDTLLASDRMLSAGGCQSLAKPGEGKLHRWPPAIVSASSGSAAGLYEVRRATLQFGRDRHMLKGLDAQREFVVGVHRAAFNAAGEGGRAIVVAGATIVVVSAWRDGQAIELGEVEGPVCAGSGAEFAHGFLAALGDAARRDWPADGSAPAWLPALFLEAHRRIAGISAEFEFVRVPHMGGA
jgi:hypothetical protein